MLSTCHLFPSSQSVVNNKVLPLTVYVQPMAKESFVFTRRLNQIPQCCHCKAYFCSKCKRTADSWKCAICGTEMRSEKLLPSDILKTDIIEISQDEWSADLSRAIIVLTNEEGISSTVKDYLNYLPSNSQITIATCTDQTNNYSFPSTRQALEQWDTIQFPDNLISIETVQKSLESILPTLNEPCWCIVIMDEPQQTDDITGLESFLKSQQKRKIRIDLNIIGSSGYSPINDKITPLINSAPGLTKVYHPFMTLSELPINMKEDLDRDFAYDLRIQANSSENYKLEFLPIQYMASQSYHTLARFPVFPSTESAISYTVTLPEEDQQNLSQTFQFIVKYTKYNNKTHRFSRQLRIINQEFQISREPDDLLQEVSPSLLLYSWMKQSQKLQFNKTVLYVEDKIKDFGQLILSNEHFIDLVKLGFFYKSHKVISISFWERFTMCVLINLASPASTNSLFSFLVEVWENADNMLLCAHSISNEDLDESKIYVVKCFPSIYVISRDGNFTVEKGTKIEKSINDYKEKCKPLNVEVIHSELSSNMKDLIDIYHEENLPNYLKGLGLESLEDKFYQN
ncbi:hypothetical protein GPJ56_001617 [Histomonas meleagridis]|uniref:uncharacterized protein n=1 Tax=Histomonas meleagridis TaxID=135588 RepID=UPI0035599581|nr:hypothetical protein GPJ56_001617 [Histomonas meleagridis]KAH0807123.1 hypothetical protein GO595_000299 [Histomonas meleagridis]